MMPDTAYCFPSPSVNTSVNLPPENDNNDDSQGDNNSMINNNKDHYSHHNLPTTSDNVLATSSLRIDQHRSLALSEEAEYQNKELSASLTLKDNGCENSVPCLTSLTHKVIKDPELWNVDIHNLGVVQVLKDPTLWISTATCAKVAQSSAAQTGLDTTPSD